MKYDTEHSYKYGTEYYCREISVSMANREVSGVISSNLTGGQYNLPKIQYSPKI